MLSPTLGLAKASPSDILLHAKDGCTDKRLGLVYNTSSGSMIADAATLPLVSDLEFARQVRTNTEVAIASRIWKFNMKAPSREHT